MALTDGSHGLVLGEAGELIVNTILISLAFILLCQPKNKSQRVILVLSSITIVAVASRILFEPLPNVQPVTFMCLIMGASLGARRGMAFAVMVTLISNTLLSNGWWTFFQATGWAGVAFAGSKLNLVINGELQMKKVLLSVVILSILFDWWVSLSIIDGSIGSLTFFHYILNGLPFDMLHVIGSVTFAIWFAPSLHSLITEEIANSDELAPVGERDVVIQ